MNISTTTTIRDRGQITLPYSIREQSDWLAVNSPVQIILDREEIIIRPPKETSSTSWEKIWGTLHLAQSFIGKQGNLGRFIIKDRHLH